MTNKNKHAAEDLELNKANVKIRMDSKAAVKSGRLKQSDLFLISPEVAKSAIIKLKP